jgi:hypothetical protein
MTSPVRFGLEQSLDLMLGGALVQQLDGEVHRLDDRQYTTSTHILIEKAFANFPCATFMPVVI